MSDTTRPPTHLSLDEKRELLRELLRRKESHSTSFHPLSHGQRSMWFLHQLAPESSAYNIVYVACIRTILDIPALQRACQKLIDRHCMLRTTYTTQNGEPVQHIHTYQKVAFDLIDAATWSEERLQEQWSQEADQPFDLARGPLLHIKVFKRSAMEHILVMTAHHIAMDFWSFALLSSELSELYTAEAEGMEISLPLARTEYTDYIRRQADMLRGAEGERLWTYWQQQLAGPIPTLDLPTDRPRPHVQTYQGAQHKFAVNEVLTERLRSLAKAEGVTFYTLLVAAFQVLLYRCTHQEDILIGTPMSGRSQPDLEKIVGHFANSVVLRANLAGDPQLSAFLKQVRHTILSAIDHQNYPISLLVERLQPPRDPSRTPFFQVMFIWDQLPSTPTQGKRNEFTL